MFLYLDGSKMVSYGVMLLMAANSCAVRWRDVIAVVVMMSHSITRHYVIASNLQSGVDNNHQPPKLHWRVLKGGKSSLERGM